MAQMAEKKSLLTNPGLHDCVTFKGFAGVVTLKILRWGD